MFPTTMVRFSTMNINKKVLHALLICLLSIFTASCVSNKETQNEQYDSDYSKSMNTIIRQMELFTNSPLIKELYIPNTLVYRYSRESCNSCISAELDYLKKIKSLVNNDNIRILPSLPETRNDCIRLKTELEDFNYTNISSEEDFPKDPITGACARYFVYFGNEKDDCYIYFPEKSTPHFTVGFLNWVVNKIAEDIKNNE